MTNSDKIGMAEWIVTKQRNGPPDVVKVVCDGPTMTFKSMASQPQQREIGWGGSSGQ